MIALTQRESYLRICKWRNDVSLFSKRFDGPVAMKFLLVVWQLVTLVAIVAMFHLWFTREKAMYWGHDTDAKRVEMFKYIGFPLTILYGTNKVQQMWAEDKRYAISGDPNLLSYPVYLLIPRMAVASSSTRIVLGANVAKAGEEFTLLDPRVPPELRMAINNVDYPEGNGITSVGEHPAPRGLLLAVLAVAGLGFFLRYILSRRTVLSLSESFSLGILLTGVLTIMSKYFFHTLFADSVVVAGCSFIGWMLFLTGKGLGKDVSEEQARAVANESGDIGWQICLGAYAIIAAMFLWSFLKTVIVVPDVWDCWAIWGAKAKMMALGSGPISDVILTGQRDYPLLWPSLWSLTGWLAGGWEDQWSKGWGPVLMLVVSAEMAWIVRRETQRASFGLLAAALFVSVPVVPLVASWGYAEPVLWCMTVSSFGMLLKWRRTQCLDDLMVAGLFAAGAAISKNEGLVFALLAFLWVAANSRVKIKPVIAYALPVTVVYVSWFCLLKFVAGAHYDSMPPLVLSFSEVMRKASHFWPSFKVALGIWADPRQWTIVLWCVGLATMICWVRGSWAARLNLLIPVLMIIGALVTIVLRNENYAWQVGAAWNRLTVQALPLLITVVVCEYANRSLRKNRQQIIQR
jgi:hypothetical protein